MSLSPRHTWYGLEISDCLLLFHFVIFVYSPEEAECKYQLFLGLRMSVHTAGKFSSWVGVIRKALLGLCWYLKASWMEEYTGWQVSPCSFSKASQDFLYKVENPLIRYKSLHLLGILCVSTLHMALQSSLAAWGYWVGPYQFLSDIPRLNSYLEYAVQAFSSFLVVHQNSEAAWGQWVWPY